MRSEVGVFAVFAHSFTTFPIQKCFFQCIQPCSVALEARRFAALLVAQLCAEKYVIADFLRRLVPMLLLRLRLRRSGESPLSWIA